MAVEDADARKARAQGLRRQIDGMKKNPRTAVPPDETPADKSRPNYRSLIDKRMHELDEVEKKEVEKKEVDKKADC